MTDTDNDRYKKAKDQIAQLEAELNEFQLSSRELEAEMEQELGDAERKNKNLQDRVYELEQNRDSWKNKYLDLQKEFNASHTSLSKQIHTLETAHKEANSRLREIEMANDDMERNERITKSSLENIESKYHDSLEEIAMLEAELAGKDDLKIDLQRTKDELRDIKEELTISQRQVEKLRTALETRTPPPSTRTISDHYKYPIVTQTAADGQIYRTERLSSSRSLRKIHGMLDQMKNLESRVARFKSSLPKSSTPTKNSSISTKNSSTPTKTSSLSSKTSKEKMDVVFLEPTIRSKPSGDFYVPQLSNALANQKAIPLQHRKLPTPQERRSNSTSPARSRSKSPVKQPSIYTLSSKLSKGDGSPNNGAIFQPGHRTAKSVSTAKTHHSPRKHKSSRSTVTDKDVRGVEDQALRFKN